ncbi:MAG TPA: NAD(P)-binding protein [Chthoniobacter sp.]|nr:NAD(P)-binding protein [Chthoniobacter sp.]
MDRTGAIVINRRAPIRTQIRLAVTLITVLCRKKIIIPQEDIYRRQRILVVGGGVSGVAAACAAEAAGFRVDVAESAPHFFPLQTRCASRWLHPHEYDWPLSHFDEESYPYTRRETALAPSALHWKAGVASGIAGQWQKKLEKFETESRGTVKCHKNRPTDIGATAREKLLRFVDVDPRNPRAHSGSARYSLVIFCLGAQENALPKSPYTGYRYWSNDPFGHRQLGRKMSPPHDPLRAPGSNGPAPRSGLHTAARPMRILISGSGDGGLQELLRLVFQPAGSEPLSAISLLRDLRVILQACPAFHKLEQGPVRRGKVYRPPAAVLWDEQTVALDQITKDPAWLQVVAYFHQRLHEEFLLGLRDITLVMGPMQDFQAFALNSFLGRLFMAFADEATCPYRDSFRVLSMTSVDDVGSIVPSHACTPDPEPCHPLPHKVLITTPDGIQTEQVFDVVILRHGQAQVMSCD